MSTYTLDFTFVLAKLPLLMQGLFVTLQLTLISVAIGLAAGFLVCLMAMSRFRPLAWIAITFIEIFRCTPALIQMIWIFYCVPIFLGVFIEPIPMAILALSLNITAFNAEAYRAAIQAIPRAHIDACEAMSLSPWIRTVYVVLPQALLLAIPVLVTNAIGLLQQSALVAIVAIGDLMYQGKSISTQSYRPIEVFTTVALIYFLVALPFSQAVGILERRLRRRTG